MELPFLDSWCSIIIALSAVLCVVLYKYFTSTHDYFKKRGVPYVKPLIFFGNLKDALLVKKTIGEVYQDLYWKMDGQPYAGIFKMSQPSLLIRDPELIKNVLVKDFPYFHDNDVEIDLEVDPVFGRNPFVLRGEAWKNTRSKITPALSSGRLKPYFPLVAETCDELKYLIESSGNGVVEFETKELCARFTTDVVATCAFGISGNSLKDPNSEFRLMGRELIDPDFKKMVKFLIVFTLPRLAKTLKLGFGTQNVQNFFFRIVKEVAQYREEKNVTRADFLQHLITLKKKGTLADENSSSNGVESKDISSEKYRFTDVDIAAQASTFFTDGFETSSAVLAFTLHCLAVHPEVQDKVRNEVDSVIRKHGGQLSYDAIQEMTYLDMALSESLRMYPPGMALMKRCTKPYKLQTPSGGTYEVEAETPVIIPVYAIHHDPKYYPDPERYDPERFNEENKKDRIKCTYIPFGEGPRQCLGSRFALMQVKAGIASVISHFEIRPNKKTQIPIVLDPNSFLLSSKGGIWLDYITRKDK